MNKSSQVTTDSFNTLPDSEPSDRNESLNTLFNLIYDELYVLARDQRAKWRGLDTLNTTALLHETYIKLKRNQPGPVENRKHFLAIASKAMRHVLINYAENRLAQKRGGGSKVVSADDVDLIADDGTAEELISLHIALSKLEKVNERQGKVVEFRFFGGMSVTDTAYSLNISEATVKRDWQAACAWLYSELDNEMT